MPKADVRLFPVESPLKPGWNSLPIQPVRFILAIEPSSPGLENSEAAT